MSTSVLPHKPTLTQILEAVPREPFLNTHLVLEDHNVPLEDRPRRYVLPTRDTLETLIRALEIAPDDVVLEVGTGFGYATTILSILAKQVHSVERLDHRLEFARKQIRALGRTNVRIHHGDGLKGLPNIAPFDAILISVSEADAPRDLLEQLEAGGRLVAALGPVHGVQRLVQYRRKAEDGFQRTHLGEIRLMPRLGDVIVDLGLAKRETVEQAAALALSKGVRIGQALQELTRIDENELYRALALQHGMKLARVEYLLDRLQAKLSKSVARIYLEHNHVLPLFREGRRLAVATTDPSADVRGLSQALNANQIDVYLLTPTDYKRLWTAIDMGYLPTVTGLDTSVLEAEPPTNRIAKPDMLAPASGSFDARIVALFDAILLDAIGDRASDIHLERYGEDVRLRFRIDGDCIDVARYRLTVADLAALVNVIKVSAELDIAERRLPQGGRIHRRAGKVTIDLRVQTQPSLHGEHVVIRLLPQDTHALLTIEDLGFPEQLATSYQRLLASPAGMVLVVGPTGSGKSTTLYAGLQLLAADVRRKVITVEDPIEYSIQGVQQTQVKPAIGFNFADAMRSFVRQDPDVILVGEIRDHETALEAVRASQTGHLLLSTLHANDSVDAIQRLFDLDMHPNSVASEVVGIIAQRLAKRVCPACREVAQPDPKIVAEVFPDGLPEDFVCYQGQGCDRCAGRGTRGRVAVIEFLPAGTDVRRAISQRLQVDELRERCLKAGLVTMRDTALELVRAGRIPFDDLPRILPAERMAPERRASQVAT